MIACMSMDWRDMYFEIFRNVRLIMTDRMSTDIAQMDME